MQVSKASGGDLADFVSIIPSQGIAINVCKEFFAPELPWGELSSEDVAKAREAVEERDSLLQGRPDIAHWLISKHHRSSSYQHVRWKSLLLKIRCSS